MENGAKVKDIQARLGHNWSTITIDTYSHLTQKMQNESVDIFEQAMCDIAKFCPQTFSYGAKRGQITIFYDSRKPQTSYLQRLILIHPQYCLLDDRM